MGAVAGTPWHKYKRPEDSAYQCGQDQSGHQTWAERNLT